MLIRGDGSIKVYVSGIMAGCKHNIVSVISRPGLASVRSVHDRFRKCFAAVKIACEMNRITSSDAQVAEFAHSVFASTYRSANRSMKGPSNVRCRPIH